MSKKVKLWSSDTSIRQLEISSRAASSLERHGIMTIGDLLNGDGFRLIRIPGLGWGSYRNIASALRIFFERQSGFKP